jgi:formylglycine-generating enzyme required for sulfatase activity
MASFSPEKYITLDLGNSLDLLEMVYIPSGSFMMGQTESERQVLIKSYGDLYQQVFACELPQHQVNIPAFYMARYPTTQAQYIAITRENPCRFQEDCRPVESISWHQAMEFCQKLSEINGKECTLPSESQWEYACRANIEKPFSFGDTITTDVANYDGNYAYDGAPQGVCREQTTDVGTFLANDFGLSDMHGNVWEWCLDDWHDSYEGAPNDGSAWLDKNSPRSMLMPWKVMRGGSWSSNPYSCRSANRGYDSPANYFSYHGFRVVAAIT